MNSFDIAAFVNYQKLNGNADVELMSTSWKGKGRKGGHNCHSWTIVDEEYLVRWITERAE